MFAYSFAAVHFTVADTLQRRLVNVKRDSANIERCLVNVRRCGANQAVLGNVNRRGASQAVLGNVKRCAQSSLTIQFCMVDTRRTFLPEAAHSFFLPCGAIPS